MITLVIGTDRKDSYTGRVCRAYAQLLGETGIGFQILDLSTTPTGLFAPGTYGQHRTDAVVRIQEAYFTSATCFVFFIPEYNGSFPGILKWLVDSMDPKKALRNKKAALFGLSSGRSGSLRSLDQWVGIMHYLQVQVMPQLTAVPHIDKEWEADGGEPSEKLKALLIDHIRHMIPFQADLKGDHLKV
jgi:NAD(P)H-dependent FMN reductase